MTLRYAVGLKIEHIPIPVTFHRCRSWLALAVLTSVVVIDTGFAQKPTNDEQILGASRGPKFEAADIEFFEGKIRPLLIERCTRCHGPEKQEASLRLDSRASVLKGGDSGPAIVPHKPNQSLMIDAIRYGDTFQMPPNQQLPAAGIALLEEWVLRGAPWNPDDVGKPAVNAGIFDLEQRKREHWAWGPIVEPTVPGVKEDFRAASAIDAFLLEKLDEVGLQRAAAADKKTLIRRATFDLIGLPPTPEEVKAFQTDPSADAFARVVDRLLASPRFGERWARHWLDLVRYAETLGHEFDYPLTDAWRYRDYVIRALNADVSYDQFLREHIAGDLLNPPRLHPTEGYNESIIATAFWYLGEAKHAPVDSRADYATRIENQLDVVSKTFLGLTVACARCHDHKFDAISTKDYYALAGYLTSSHQQVAMLDPNGRIESGVQQLKDLQRRGRDEWKSLLTRRGEEVSDLLVRCLLTSRVAHGVADESALIAAAEQYQVDRELLKRFIAAAAEPAAQEPGHPLFAWNKLVTPNKPAESFRTRRSALEAELQQRSNQVATSAPDHQVFEDFSSNFDKWFLSGWAFGESPTSGGDWRSSPNGPELLAPGMAHSGRLGTKLQGVMRSSNFTIEKPYILYRLSGSNAQIRLVVDGYAMDRFTPLLFEGLSFQVDADRAMYWHNQSIAKYLGHQAHIEIIDSGDGFVAVDEIRFATSATTPLLNDSTAAQILSKREVVSVEMLAKAYGEVLHDSVIHWLEGKPSAGAELVSWVISQRLLPKTNDAALTQLANLTKKAAAIDSELPSPLNVVAIADGSGDDQRVYIRGNYKNLGEAVPRRLLEAIAGTDQPQPLHGSGRLKLAEQMLGPDNPFTARVMANRVWQHLFGRGIVATVDNFGVLGQKPTHPKLLDYLATRFRHEGWSIKKLIREIMLSDAYQMKSVSSESAEKRDPLNLLLHRANVRRLEGEAIRDSLLAVSGRLELSQLGPSVPIHLSPFMEGRGRPSQSGPLDGDGRRSVYVEVRRNFLSPFLIAFDTPLPMSTVGCRNVSNVPSQSLAMLNDPFVVEQCQRWAERTLAEKERSPADRVTSLYLLAFSRPPTEHELDDASSFLEEQAKLHGVGLDDVHPWADLCHVLVNVKEFIFIK